MAREIYTGDKMGKLFIVLLLGINLVFASDFWEKGWHVRCAKGSASMAGRDFFGAACFSPLQQAAAGWVQRGVL